MPEIIWPQASFDRENSPHNSNFTEPVSCPAQPLNVGFDDGAYDSIGSVEDKGLLH